MSKVNLETILKEVKENEEYIVDGCRFYHTFSCKKANLEEENLLEMDIEVSFPDNADWPELRYFGRGFFTYTDQTSSLKTLVNGVNAMIKVFDLIEGHPEVDFNEVQELLNIPKTKAQQTVEVKSEILDDLLSRVEIRRSK